MKHGETMMYRSALLAFSFGLMVACASTSGTSNSTDEGDEKATDRAVRQTEAGFQDAALTPLTDLNLKRAKIPALLKQIDNPYAVSEHITCDQIADEVTQLNAILGRDWDVPPPDKKKLKNQAADGASTALLDAVSSTAGGFIPYRGVVRQVTGATKHQKKVIRAYERGSHRRTFLKAMGLLKECESPAAPLPLPIEDPKVEFR